jgi:hypothetical protein
MTRRFCRVAALAGLLLWQATSTRADDAVFGGPAWAPRLEQAGSCDGPVRLPPVEARISGSESLPMADPAAGTVLAQAMGPGWWQDDHSFADNPLPPQQAGEAGLLSGPHSMLSPAAPGGGTVCGRLVDRGRPLVNCHVVIVPLHEAKGVYLFDSDRQVLDTVTDEDGNYRFENVPAGEYKLTWLPAGKTQWIRRIAARPDVKVHYGEATKLKEIRVAMQTIN